MKYELQNNTSEPIELKLMDQFPVSQRKELKVELLEFSGANVDEEKGEVTWILNLKPNKLVQKELSFLVNNPGDLGPTIQKYIPCPAPVGGRLKFSTPRI